MTACGRPHQEDDLALGRRDWKNRKTKIMSQSVNRAILVGNLGRDSELFSRQSAEGRIANRQSDGGNQR